MQKYKITGSGKLSGEVTISGSKNIALKAIVAACLTEDKVTIHNVPNISDVSIMLGLVSDIGGVVTFENHTVVIHVPEVKTSSIPLEAGAKTRSSTLFLAPLLARVGEAIIPNPGGCRIGARPIDRIVSGLEKMGVDITYNSEDGYFHAQVKESLKGATYHFDKPSHTGTETMILAAVLAKGTTIIENAAREPEVDSLISMLNQMGAKIRRTTDKTIEIQGVGALHGVEFTIPQDRNEVVTFAVASVLTGGNIWIQEVDFSVLEEFIVACAQANIEVEQLDGNARFYAPDGLQATDIVTIPHPGFMTDWQGVWALLMTQAEGISSIHETVYENRFGYKKELNKMGAKIKFIPDNVSNRQDVYNFNFDPSETYHQKIEIEGKTPLHNAVLEMSDLRAGATVVLAALIASGTSIIYGIEHVQRGYEDFDKRLRALGADITVEDEI